MRFDSIDNLIQFLGVLGTQGYSIPFRDYANELRANGMVGHIHNYKVRLLTVSTLALKLVFFDKDTIIYSIEMQRSK